MERRRRPTVTGVSRKRLEKLRAQNRNLQTSVDALAEELDATQRLCVALAEELSKTNADFVESLPVEMQELWDVVKPFGPDDGEGE